VQWWGFARRLNPQTDTYSKLTVDETLHAHLSVLITVFMHMLHNIDNLGWVFHVV